jgi:hypothetical protein
MIGLFICRAAKVLGPAAMLWIMPASAADLAVTARQSVSTEFRSSVSGKKALTAARTSRVRHFSAQRDKSASAQRDRQASSGERNNSEIWYRRQFVLLVGVAY